MEVKIKKAFKFRLELTQEQNQRFRQFAGASRFAYNYALDRKKTVYKETGKTITSGEIQKEITRMKKTPEYEWLNDLPSQIPQQAVQNVDRAFDGFFKKRSGFPKFKKKHSWIQSFRIPQNIKVKGGRVFVPKLGYVKMIQSREIEGTIKGATFRANHLGQWFVSINTECILEKPAEIFVSDCTGVDLGLKDVIVTSTGHRQPAPKFFRQGERKIKKLSRRLSRKVRGSKNRSKARRALARAHLRIGNQRSDFTHKITTNLIRNHEALAFESLNVKGMSKTKLSKSIHDTAFGEIKRQAEYKGLWYDVPFIPVDRWFPSSKLCSVCEYKNNDLSLSDREWMCPDCKTHHDRDINAARNLRIEGLSILAAGSTESINAYGVRVRLARPAVNSEVGIPHYSRPAA
jgi:putative transposase